jgi:hypothetical protein
MNKIPPKLHAAAVPPLLPLLLLLSAGFTGLSALEDLPLVNAQTVSLEGIGGLSISYGQGDVILRESASGELVIREYMNRDNPRYYAEISRAAGELRIVRGGRPWFFGFLFRSRAEIYLPPAFHGNLRITNSSGSFSGEADLRGYETIDISVGSGSVALNRLSAGTVSIRVSSGGLNAAGIGGNSFVSVSSGRLEIGELAGGEHRIKVSSGRTRIGVLEGAADIEISSGNIALEKFRGRIDLDISSGSVNMGDFSGEGSFELSSGNLNMDVRELDGDLRFRLSSGDVDMDVPAGLSFNLDALTKSGTVRVNEGGTEALRVSGNGSVLRPIGPAPESGAAVRTIYARTTSGKVIINRR